MSSLHGRALPSRSRCTRIVSPGPVLSSDGSHCSWLLSLSGRCWRRHVQAFGAPSIHPHAVRSHAGCADRQARGVHCHADPPEAVPRGDGGAWRPTRVVCCWSLYLASKCTQWSHAVTWLDVTFCRGRMPRTNPQTHKPPNFQNKLPHVSPHSTHRVTQRDPGCLVWTHFQ